MTEELRFHIEQYTDDLVRSGVPPREAARRARIEFGSLNSAQEECREARGLRPFDELIRQLRHAARLLRKTPRFTATALATVAVCLGANLTIFAVVDSILLRPLPFPEAGRLVTVFNTYPKAGVDRDGSSVANYYERRGRIPAFAGVAMIPNPPRSELTGLADVLLGSLGLTGVIVLAAVLVGFVFATVLFWVRSRQE